VFGSGLVEDAVWAAMVHCGGLLGVERFGQPVEDDAVKQHRRATRQRTQRRFKAVT
jgi:hypothetical protein